MKCDEELLGDEFRVIIKVVHYRNEFQKRNILSIKTNINKYFYIHGS